MSRPMRISEHSTLNFLAKISLALCTKQSPRMEQSVCGLMWRALKETRDPKEIQILDTLARTLLDQKLYIAYTNKAFRKHINLVRILASSSERNKLQLCKMVRV